MNQPRQIHEKNGSINFTGEGQLCVYWIVAMVMHHPQETHLFESEK